MKGKADTKADMNLKREYAKTLYIEQGITKQSELAERVGVSAQTITKWVNSDNEAWRRMRESFLVTKEQELRRLYLQLTELNDAIFNKPVGERFANSKEADIMVKLTASVRQLETDTSTADAMEVLKEFLLLVREDDLELARTITKYADFYIKTLINKGR